MRHIPLTFYTVHNGVKFFLKEPSYFKKLHFNQICLQSSQYLSSNVSWISCEKADISKEECLFTDNLTPLCIENVIKALRYIRMRLIGRGVTRQCLPYSSKNDVVYWKAFDWQGSVQKMPPYSSKRKVAGRVSFLWVQSAGCDTGKLFTTTMKTSKNF